MNMLRNLFQNIKNLFHRRFFDSRKKARLKDSFEKTLTVFLLLFLISDLIFLLILLIFPPFYLNPFPMNNDEPFTNYRIWKGGNDDWDNSTFGIKLELISVDLKNSQTIKLNYVIRTPTFKNGSIVYISDNSGSIIIDYKVTNSTLINPKKYSLEMEYSSTGVMEYYPWDIHIIQVRFDALDQLYVNETNQISAGCLSLNSNWKIISDSGQFDIDDNYLFEYEFIISREPFPIIFALIIPLIILSGIFVITIITRPWVEFKFKPNSNEKRTEKKEETETEMIEDDFHLENERIRNSRTFRVDTTRWLLAFSFANIFFVSNPVSGITIASNISIMALVFCVLYYLTCNSQGLDFSTNVSILTSIISIILVIIVVILSIWFPWWSRYI